MSPISVKRFASCTNEDIADALLTLAAPLIAGCGTDEAMTRHVVSLAVTGWNLSLFDAEGADDYRSQVDGRLPTALPDDQREIFTRFVLQLIAAKQERYPALRKGIKTWELRFQGDTFALTVEALPVKPL